jgi:hypothetical protein
MSARSSSAWQAGRWAGVAALGALVLVGLAGCPRDPESPSEGGGQLVNLSDPDSVLFQLQVGVRNGVITQYMNAFTQNFVFNPDQVDSISLSQQLPGVFDNWTFDVEQQVMQLVLISYAIRSVQFTDVESTSVNDREVVLREDYTLLMDSERYHGEAEFFMIKESSNDWRIFRWRDRQGTADPDTTWGILKGIFR